MFWQLLQESVIVSGIIAVALVGAVCYLAVTGQEIPETLGLALSLVLGFFFGAKTQASGAAHVGEGAP